MSCERSISVTATGNVPAVFDRCTFKVSTSVVEKTTVKCKEAIIPKIKEIDACIRGFNFVSTGSHKASSSVEPERTYKNGAYINQGYKYKYTVTFRINDLTKVNEVMDALTSLNDVEMDAPMFSIKNDNEQKTAAMNLAFELAKKNFVGQCAMAGVNPNDFKLTDWDIHEGRSHSQHFSKSSTSGNEAFSPMWEASKLEIPEAVRAGAATISVQVTLNYAEREYPADTL